MPQLTPGQSLSWVIGQWLWSRTVVRRLFGGLAARSHGGAGLPAAAEAGDPEAQFRYGIACRDAGRLDEALRWFTAAAEQGHVPAMVNLGANLSDRGDNQEALRWLVPAAGAGDLMGLFNAGNVNYRLGDVAAAVGYMRQAREAGHPKAAAVLARWGSADGSAHGCGLLRLPVPRADVVGGATSPTAVDGQDDEVWGSSTDVTLRLGDVVYARLCDNNLPGTVPSVIVSADTVTIFVHPAGPRPVPEDVGALDRVIGALSELRDRWDRQVDPDAPEVR